VIVVDTGVLYATADEDDAHHLACATLLGRHPGPLLVPVTVITETSWLIETRLGPAAEARFLRATRGELSRVDLLDQDWDRAIETGRNLRGTQLCAPHICAASVLLQLQAHWLAVNG
jgi:uncharacterized protein